MRLVEYRKTIGQFSMICLVMSAIGFGVWQRSFGAGIWWLFGACVVDEILDKRSWSERFKNYCTGKAND